MAGRVRGLLERFLARNRARAADGPTDLDLLRRFARDRDPAAFELLVWRHGGAVLGVCRRALRDEHAAEDAFQAVFLLLARKAGGVRGNVGGWLFKVARRVSARAAARRAPVLPPADRAAEPAPDRAETNELAALLDAEVSRLPERLRAAVVLCYLGGHTTDDAARELGCPRGTILSRLAAARERLAARLSRRGVALPAALACGVGSPLVSAASAAARDAALAGPVATELATEVLRAMNRTATLTALGGVLALALATGAGVLAARDGGEGDGPPAPAPVAKPAPPAAPERKPELPANERKELEAVIKVLEREVDTLRGLLSEQERLLAESTPRGTEKDKLAKNRNRYEETEEEYRRVNREAMKLAVEAQVLKQTIDHKEEVEPPASLIEAEFARDARLVPLREVLRTARNSYAFVVNMAPGGPQVDEAKKELAKAEDALKRREGELRKEVTARVREQLTAKHRERLAEVNIELKVKTEYAKRLKNEADALREVVAGLERALDNNSDLLQSRIEQLRAHLARVETELFAVRLTARGVPMQPVAAPAASDDKLDRILRELAALRKDVQELKAQRK